MPPIVFPTSSAPGRRPQESAGRLINAFVEKSPAGAPGQSIWLRSLGFRKLITYGGAGHTRGFLDMGLVGMPDTIGSTLPISILWALDNKIVHITHSPTLPGSYTLTDLGTLPGTDFVTMARNHNFPTHDASAVAGGAPYKIGRDIAPVLWPDLDLPRPPDAECTSVAAVNNYLVWSYRDGRIFASQLDDPAVQGDSFTTELGQQVLRLVRFANRLYAFGDKWTGVYRDAGTQPFPFLREATIPRGIIGTHAIAGWELGWANQLIWVGEDFVVYKLNGLIPVPISTPDVSWDIQRTAVRSQADEVLRAPDHFHAFVYMNGNNAFWVLSSTFPETGFQWTWEYNATTGQWNERKTDAMENWRACKSVSFDNTWHFGDVINGDLHRAALDTHWDDVNPVTWTVESGVMTGFPNRTSVSRASFNMTGGGDEGAISGGEVDISWSIDGGATWGLPLKRPIGTRPMGTYPFVICSGLTWGQGIRWRLRVTHSDYVALMHGDMQFQGRAP